MHRIVLLLALAGCAVSGWACRRPVPPLAGYLTVTLRSAQGGQAAEAAAPP